MRRTDHNQTLRERSSWTPTLTSPNTGTRRWGTETPYSGETWATSPDPQTLNLYGYVRNNPLSKADVDGHRYPWCTALGGGILGGVISGGGEIIAAKLRGQPINWKQVKGAAVQGAVMGASIGVAGPQAGVDE